LYEDARAPYTAEHAGSPDGPAGEPAVARPELAEESLLGAEDDGAPSPLAGEDLDGARLVALNMALNGDPREQTDRYISENFDVPDRERLLDEVYAAIEG
jgi:hypothetical protein